MVTKSSAVTISPLPKSKPYYIISIAFPIISSLERGVYTVTIFLSALIASF
jgi:hypothetical protein